MKTGELTWVKVRGRRLLLHDDLMTWLIRKRVEK